MVGRLVVVVVVVVGLLVVVVVVVVEGGRATGRSTLCSGTSEGRGCFRTTFLRLDPVLQRKLWKA